MRATGTQVTAVPSLLLVTPENQHEQSLRDILAGTSYAARRVENCSEALQILEDLKPGVLIVEADLRTGDWRRLLEGALARPWSPQVIVFSSLADDCLWAEVLNMGGYDVLALPFRPDEVLRTVALAADARARRASNKSATAA